MKKIISIAIRCAISLLCLVYAFRGVPLHSLREEMSAVPLMPVFWAVAVSFAAYAVMALRMARMRDPHIPFGSSFCASLVCLALNNVLPAKAGEVAKAAWLKRRNGIAMDEALGLVFMERFFDVNVLALLSVWFLWKLNAASSAFVLLLCLAFGWCVLLILRRYPALIGLFAKLPLPEKITSFIIRFTEAVTSQITVRRTAWMTVSSLVLWALYCVQMTFVLNGAYSMGLSWGDAVGVFAVSSLGMLLPSSPGAIGVYEAAVVTALTSCGVANEQALAAALVAHMVQFIPVTLAGGAVFLKF